MQNTEIIHFIAEEVRGILNKYIDSKIDKSANQKIKDDILSYLNSINQKMGYNNIPHVVVETEGTFVTVNFEDYQGNRLETLGDVIYFMSNNKSMVL